MKTTAQLPCFFVIAAIGLFQLTSRADPPPFPAATVLHSSAGDLWPVSWLGGRYFSLYDPSGQIDRSQGILYHDTTAFASEFGTAECTADDEMMIPFTVGRPGNYTLTMTFTVRIEVYSLGEQVGLTGSDWGDFNVWMWPLTIEGGGVLHGVGSLTLYQQNETLWDAVSPVLWDTLFHYIPGGDAISEWAQLYDQVKTASDAVTFLPPTNFTASTTLNLNAGITYKARTTIGSTIDAKCVVVGFGGHFSGLKATVQVLDFSVIPEVAILTVASSNPASGVLIPVAPDDNGGARDGTTQFTRTFNVGGSPVTLTAPALAGSHPFLKWQRDGLDWAVTQTTTVTMDASHTLTAVYGNAPDPGAPVVTILFPTTASTWVTAGSPVTLRGSASGNVLSVTWNNSTTDESGTARGTNSWSANVYLDPGTNYVTVTAVDDRGRQGSDSITVTYNALSREVSLPATASAWIASGSPANNYRDSFLYVGYDTNKLYHQEHSLIRFDLTSIPLGSTVSNASLTLYLKECDPPNAADCDITVHRISQDWGEATVNWNPHPSTASVGSAPVTVHNTINQPYSWDVTATVLEWATNRWPNYGFLSRSTSAETATVMNDRAFLSSRESPGFPMLKINYTPEHIPPTVTITIPTSEDVYTTASASISLGGTASDNYSVASVIWANAATAQNGPASGTTNWTASVPLSEGTNIISVVAKDLADNTGSAGITVVYNPPDTTPPSVPTNVVAANLSARQTLVTWSGCADPGGTGVQGYQIYRNGSFIGSTPFLQFSDTNVIPNSNYCYTVAAYDNATPSNVCAQSAQACTSYQTPTITASPQTQTVMQGSNVTFNISATGTGPLSYQWRCNGTDLANFANVGGAFSPTLTISNVQPMQAGSYSVLVQNAGGSTNSSSAALTVLFPPTLTAPRFAADGEFSFWLFGNANKCYQVEVSTNLVAWSLLSTVTNATGVVQFTDTNGPRPKLFYRAKLLP